MATSIERTTSAKKAALTKNTANQNSVTTQSPAVQKNEETRVPEGVERTTARPVFRPRVDIIENDQSIVLLVDMPGVDETTIDITLDKHVLTIRGTVNITPPEDLQLVYSEYEVGDFERSFTISNEINCDQIEATVKDGVLKLVLPKTERIQTKKIPVTAR